MKRILLLLASIFVCTFLIPSGVANAQMRNMRVCMPGNSPAFTYLYAAKAKGYFAQEKMQTELIVARGQLCVTALMSDQINFTVNPNALDLMVEGKLKGKVIYNPAKGLAHRLIVAPTVKSFRDLKGKIIAISTFGGLTDKVTRDILREHGLVAMKDVLLLQVGTGAVRFAALKSDRVQGALLVGQHVAAALHDGFRELEFESPPHLSGPMTVTNDVLAGQRPMVHSFLRAAMKGHLFFKQRPEEVVPLIQKVFRVEDRTVAEELYKDEMGRYVPWGRPDEAYLKRAIARIKEERGVKSEVAIKDVFDLSIAKEIEAELKKQNWKP